MKTRYYIIIGIVSYLLFTISNAPASRVIELVRTTTDMPVAFYGTYGSLWQGGADKLQARGAPEIQNIKWDISPAALLIAHISGDLQASILQQNVVGQFSLPPNGNLKLSDVRARITGEAMQELVQMPLGELGGVFNIQINSVESLHQTIPVVDGTINWKSAKLTLAETVDLGNINIEIRPADEGSTQIKIDNTGGQVSINGKATLEQNKQYAIDLTLTPENSATQNIKQSLSMFARRQSDGSYQLKRKGNLKEFGI